MKNNIPLFVPVVEPDNTEKEEVPEPDSDESGKEKTASLYNVNILGETKHLGINGIPKDRWFGTNLVDCLKIKIPEVKENFEISIYRHFDRCRLNLFPKARSAFLGIFIQAYKYKADRSFKDKWDTITVTGELKPHVDKIDLVNVGEITEKYKSVERYAKENKDKTHLFLYISDDEKNLPKHDNIEVKVFHSGQDLGEILSFLFKPIFNDEQQKLLDNCEKYLNRPKEYVSTKTFEDLKKEAASSDWNGCFIHGQGDSGKSTIALELVYWLVENEFVYAPIWINIDNQELQMLSGAAERIKPNINKKGIVTGYDNDSTTIYLASLIAKQLRITHNDWQAEDSLEILRAALTKDKHRYILVIDNLECPQVDEILKSLKRILLSCNPKQPVIVTSYKEKIGVSKDELELSFIQSPSFTENEVEYMVKITAKKNKLEHKLTEWENKSEYKDFLKYLHANFNSLPGMIEKIIPHLRKKNIQDLQSILLSQDVISIEHKSINDDKIRVYEAIIDNFDECTQAVLYSFINTESPDSESEDEDDSEDEGTLIDKIFKNIKDSRIILHDNNGIILNDIMIKCKIEDALKELELWHLIYQIDNLSGKLKYRIKTHDYVSFMFNPKLEGKSVYVNNKQFGKMNSKISLRNCLVHPEIYILEGILYNQPAYLLEPKLERIDKNKIKNNYFLHKASFWSNDTVLIELFLKYDKDINRQWADLDNKTPLHFAAERNKKPDMIRCLLFNEEQKHITDDEGNTPLHYAAENNENPEVIDLLLDNKNILLNIKNNEGETPLHLAARSNINPNVINRLLEIGAKYNIENKSGYTSVHYAAFNNDINIINSFIRKDRNALFLIDKYGQTPLNYLLTNTQYMDIISWLEENKIDINGAYGPLELSLLHSAALNENEYIFNSLLEKGANPEATDLEGAKVINYAAMNPKLHLMKEDEDIITVLINKGLDINNLELLGGTPLHNAAVFNESPESVLHVLNKGAREVINLKNKIGFSPLFFALTNENPEIAIMLINEGASINEKFTLNQNSYQIRKDILLRKNPSDWNKEYLENIIKDAFDLLKTAVDYTPLHYAARFSNNDKIIKFLLEKGAEVNAVEKNGYTPLHIAAICNENLEVIKALVDNKANIEAVDEEEGCTPLHLAADNNENTEIILMLINAGASLNIRNKFGKTPVYYMKKSRSDWKILKKAIKESRKENRNKF